MLKVAVLCSHRAPGLLYLLNRDRERGRLYEVVCCVTSERTFAEEVRVERRGVPTIAHPIREFYEARGASLYCDRAVREEYDSATAALLKPYAPDLVLLDGYLYLVTEPLLVSYAARMINVHFADLTLRLPDGRPRFPGIRAVRDTLQAGLTETRATVHLVNDEPDGGAPIVRSWALPVSPMARDARVWDAVEMFRAYAFAHQQWMIRGVAGPLAAAAVRLIAEGKVDLAALARRAPETVVPWDIDRKGAIRAAHPHAA
jgi:folate-dependent phosphoribosylglycinamide formyltransferase PurN